MAKEKKMEDIKELLSKYGSASVEKIQYLSEKTDDPLFEYEVIYAMRLNVKFANLTKNAPKSWCVGQEIVITIDI